MCDRLSRHRVDQASSQPYNTRLGDKFTPAEHEYIAEQVVNHVESQEVQGRISYMRNVKGEYPDRRYVGPISLEFLNAIFRS